MQHMKYFFIFMICLAFVAVFYESAFAADVDVVSQIVEKFKTKAASWESSFKKVALNIFGLCVTLEICWLGIQIALNRQDIGEAVKHFVLALLAAGFFLAVINNYQTWTWNLINGLQTVAQGVGPIEAASDNPVKVGMDIIKKIMDVVKGINDPRKIGTILAFFIAALVVLVCFALITAQIILIKCEAAVATMAALILVGLGGTSFFRDYAKNTLRYVVAAAFKLFVMYLVLGIGMSFIDDFKTTVAAGAEFSSLVLILTSSIVVLALVKSLPDIVAGIINGSHVGSGTALTAAAAAVGGAMLGAGAMMAGAGKGVAALKDAANIAGMEGKTGLGKLAGMAGHLAGAAREAGRGGMGQALQRRRQTAMEAYLTAEMNKD